MPTPTGNRPDTNNPLQNPLLKNVTGYGRVQLREEDNELQVNFPVRGKNVTDADALLTAMTKAFISQGITPLKGNDTPMYLDDNGRDAIAFKFKAQDESLVRAAVNAIDRATTALRKGPAREA